MSEEVKHYQVNGKYKVQFERGATKGVIGYKVEANGDSLEDTFKDAETLKNNAELIAGDATEKKENIS